MTVATDLADALATFSDEPLVVLAEMTFAYETGGNVANGTIYLSDGLYITKPGETPASTAYIDAITALPQFSRRIDARRLMGAAAYSVGSLELANADGRLDFMLTAIVDGWPCEFYLGHPGWRRNQFIRALSAIVERVSAPAPDQITVALRDPGYLLDKRISGAAIGGSTVNAGKYKPIGIGAPRQVEAVLGDSANLRYWLGAAVLPSAVRDNGVSLMAGYASISGTNAAITADAGTDTITFAAHGFSNEQVVIATTTGGVFAGMTAGTQYWVRNKATNTFQLSATRTGAILNLTGTTFAGTMTIAARGFYLNGDGSIDLSATPSGRITADLLPPEGGANTALATALEQVALTYGGLEPMRWGGAHASYTADASTEINVGYYITEPENAVEILDRLAASNAAWCGFARDGVLRYGGLWALNDSSQMTITTDMLVDRHAVTCERLPIMFGQIRLIYERNWTQQTDLASSLSAEARATYAGAGPQTSTAVAYGTAYLTNKPLYHRSMTDSPVIDTMMVSLGAATNWEARFATVYAPYLDVIRIETDLSTLGLELGDKVTLETGFPLAGSESTIVRVIGIDVSLTERRVTLALLYRRGGDYSTATYYG